MKGLQEQIQHLKVVNQLFSFTFFKVRAILLSSSLLIHYFPPLKQDELARVRRQSIGRAAPSPTVLNHKVMRYIS